MPASAIRKLGHVVLNVSSLARSAPFYVAMLGLKEVGRLRAAEEAIVGAPMVFFSFGDSHHDLALREVPLGPGVLPQRLGLAHVAFRIGDGIAQLHDHAAPPSRVEHRFRFYEGPRGEPVDLRQIP